jgi:multiple sugar transport system permease protein
MPGIASASIFTAFLSWNEFLLASAVTREAAKPLTVTIAGFVTDKGTLWGPMMAMSSLVVIPMVIFALWLQKYLVKGIMLGAVKE